MPLIIKEYEYPLCLWAKVSLTNEGLGNHFILAPNAGNFLTEGAVKGIALPLEIMVAFQRINCCQLAWQWGQLKIAGVSYITANWNGLGLLSLTLWCHAEVRRDYR